MSLITWWVVEKNYRPISPMSAKLWLSVQLQHCTFLKFYIKIMFVYIHLCSVIWFVELQRLDMWFHFILNTNSPKSQKTHFQAFIWFYVALFYFIACLSQAIVCHQNKHFHCTLPVKDICANLGAGLGCDHLFLNWFFTVHQIDIRTSTLLLDFQILLDNIF